MTRVVCEQRERAQIHWPTATGLHILDARELGGRRRMMGSLLSINRARPSFAGAKRYPAAGALMITTDGGGSNGSRCRLWKVALQSLASRLRLPIHVCHFPSGTSKWNKIEHRMFSHITQN